MSKAKAITLLIKNFKTPPRDFFEEIMLSAEKDEYVYYKAGIFICEKNAMQHYASLEEYWTRSFYAFVENTRIGNLFHKSIPLIHWQTEAQENFCLDCLTLLEKYTPEQIGDNYLDIPALYSTIQNTQSAVNILDKHIISSAALSDNFYISYFILDDDIAMQNKWQKKLNAQTFKQEHTQ